MVHEHKLGWVGHSWAADDDDAFPYGMITLSGKIHHVSGREGGGLTFRSGDALTTAGKVTGAPEALQSAKAKKFAKNKLNNVFRGKLGSGL